jgi:hypothetical protein
MIKGLLQDLALFPLPLNTVFFPADFLDLSIAPAGAVHTKSSLVNDQRSSSKARGAILLTLIM